VKNNKQMTVVDLNAGLGERAYTFLNAGFKVLAVTEPAKHNSDICRSVLSNVPIIEKPLDKIVPEEIPESDILAGCLTPTSSMKQSDFDIWNKSLSYIIMYHAPKILLFQVSPLFMSKHHFEFLDTATRRRYSFSYQTLKEFEYSGFPVRSHQSYIIATRNDLPLEYSFFPAPNFHNCTKSPFIEEAKQVDTWYRTSNYLKSIQTETFEEGCYYTRVRPNDLIKTDYIGIPRFRETFLYDNIGLRRLTHNEYAYLKGITYFDFNLSNKKHPLYLSIISASNLYIFNPMVELIRKYLDGLTGNDDRPADFPAKEILKEKPKQKRKKKDTNKTADSLFKPQNRLTHLHITQLKGLKNLDIEFNKNLTAIMGVNGVGKSTILHALACVFAPIKEGENYQFNFFFTPTPDASWRDSSFSITYFDEIKQKEINKEYKKKSDRWSPPYSNRPPRELFYLGIDSALPEIERERQTSYIDYNTKSSEDNLASRITKDASEILNKDYKELTDHTTKRKKLFGVRTHSGVIYSSLSMGAGEQRVLKILSLARHAAPYTMILIDEIDLLLHDSALVNLIRVLSKIAEQKNLQIIFTTHSLLMGELSDIVDIKYLRNTNEKTFIYNAITPDIVYDLSHKSEHKLNVYVEDDVAAAIVAKVLREMKILRHSRIQNIGSIQNAFIVSAAAIIEGRKKDNMLIITDGDRYRTDEEKKTQIKKVLSGSEKDHEEKIEKALSIITELSLPEDTPPEKYIFDMLISLDSESEMLECANFVKNVSDSHDFLNQIVEQMNQNREIVLRDIVELVAEHTDWEGYTQKVRDRLQEKARLLNLM